MERKGGKERRRGREGKRRSTYSGVHLEVIVDLEVRSGSSESIETEVLVRVLTPT